MSSLQPIHALNLDSVQQQSFVKYYNSLPEKPPTTVRIFDRNDYYSVHGIDATTAAKEVFSSLSNIKRMGLEPNKLDYLVLSKGNFEILVRKLLLVKGYRVEIYVASGSVKSNDWSLQYKASPGCLDQLEDVLADGLTGMEGRPSCLMAVIIGGDSAENRSIGVACVSGSEYQLQVSELSYDELLSQLDAVVVQMAPQECLVPQSDALEYKALTKVLERANITVTKLKKSDFTTEGLTQDLNRLLKFKENQQQDANVFPETKYKLAMKSLAAALKYMALMTDSSNFGRYRISTIHVESFLHLDAFALSALNVFPEPTDTSHAAHRSVYSLLDKCRTTHGKRLLAQWLRQPLRDINLINERLDIVEVFVNNSQLRLQLYEDHLRRMPDLQALARRLTKKKASLQDCYRIYQAIKRVPALLQCLSAAESASVHAAIAEPTAELCDDLTKYTEMIDCTVDSEAVERGDFLVKPSFDEQLQSLAEQLDQLQNNAERELSKAAKDLGLDAGKTIKLEINPQNGFCFRVTLKEEQNLRGNKKYTIIDSVKAGVRFKTSKLESLAEDYVQAKSTYEKEQDKVVTEIVGIAAGYSDCLTCLSHTISRLDVLVSFAMAACAAPAPYCRPTVVESLDEFVLEEARHPCLELQEGISYIPNDVVFERGEAKMYIVTGANMGGKSTWMRSAGVNTLLAHCGSFVASRRAVVPRLKAICARVGAEDREQQGQSTFMREMLETAAIHRTATPDSLVLIDELGRGTSTYEGCGLAWAIAEELATKSQCFCLFATHYHELTRLPASLPGRVANCHAEASVSDGQLLLLHKIVRGPATHSLGLQVAAIADLPTSVLECAEAKQAELEINPFETETEINPEETKKGQELIADFLKKFKEIEETSPNDEMVKKVLQLQENVRQTSNKYVKALLSHLNC